MAPGILTNVSAATALQNLEATQKALSTTQSQISSGLRVSTAADGAAYWSIASTLKSDTGALSAVSDALSLGSSVITTATAAIASTLVLLNRLKADLVTARQPGTSLASVQTDIAAQQKSLAAVLSSASFNGVNLLDGSAGVSSLSVTEVEADDDVGDASSAEADSVQSSSSSLAIIRPIGHPVFDPVPISTSILGVKVLNFVSSFARSGSGTASTGAVGTVALDTTTTNIIGSGGVLTGSPGAGGTTAVLTMDITAAPAGLATMAADLDAAIASVTAIGARIGGVGTVIVNQQTYVKALSDSLTSGVSSLVDADMNVASTRLQALQAQQQLGVQALSIANQNSRLTLKLFVD